MRLGQRPAAELGVLDHRARLHRLDQGRALRVPELAQVEVALDAVDPGRVQPAEHDVARSLHQPLALDHALAVVGELALAEERLEHRGLRLLRLQEQRVVAVAAEHQDDPGAGADAADADDLAGGVDEAEPLEQATAVAGEGAPVLADQVPEPILDVRGLLGADKLGDRDDQRRIADDPRLAVDHLGQLGERLQAVLRPRLLDVLAPSASAARRLRGRRSPRRTSSTSTRAYQTSMLRIAPNSCIASRYERPTVALIFSRVLSSKPRSRPATAKLATRRLTSHSNGPGRVSSKSLSAEDEPPVGRREGAEVGQVRVAAELGVQPGTRAAGQIGRHQVRSAAVEGERRDEHPAVADRHQLGHARLRLLLEQLDRVGPVRRRLPLGVRAARHLCARRLAARGPLLRGEVLDLRGGARARTRLGLPPASRGFFSLLGGHARTSGSRPAHYTRTLWQPHHPERVRGRDHPGAPM